ncbi:adenine methyltransferase, partial [Glaesserella parasuis]
IGGRIAFVHPITGEEIKGNSKGQMVVVFDPTMEDFVQRSVSLDFIKKVGGYFRKEQVGR